MLHDALECSICLETLSLDNKVLPCQHTFCRKCLEEVKESQQEQFECPECRLHVSTEINKLPSNIILNRVLANLCDTLVKPSCSSSQTASSVTTPIKDANSSQSVADTPQSVLKNSQIVSTFLQNLVPCTAQQVNRIIDGNEDMVNGAIPHKISIVGILRNINRFDTYGFYILEIDDGTGESLSGKFWPYQDEMPKTDRYVEVFGKISTNRDMKSFIIEQCSEVKDPNKITNHMLEIVRNSMQYRKSKEVESAAIMDISDDQYYYVSDSSGVESVHLNESIKKSAAKRRILIEEDSSSNTEDYKNYEDKSSPPKKQRRRIQVFDESSEETEDSDFSPVASSSAKKNKKKVVNISSSEDEGANVQNQPANISNSDTEEISDEDLIKEAMKTPDRPIPQPNASRSSSRIKQKPEFSMPSRKAVFDSIPTTPATEKSYEELRQRKVVNDFTKISSRYNFDPNYTSGEDSFIDDQFEYVDDSSLVSEDSNYDSEYERQKIKSKSSASKKGGKNKRTLKKNISARKGKKKKQGKKSASSDNECEDSSKLGNVRNKKYISVSSFSGSDTDVDKSNDRKQVKDASDDGDSDLGELSKSILKQVSQRSRTMTRKRKEKRRAFDNLKEERVKKNLNKK